MSHVSVLYHPTPLGSGSANIFISRKVNRHVGRPNFGPRNCAQRRSSNVRNCSNCLLIITLDESSREIFGHSNIFARRSLSCGGPCDRAHAAARHRELVVNKAFELGDDHVVIIFLEVSGIKSASLDEKSQVGVQPYTKVLSEDEESINQFHRHI